MKRMHAVGLWLAWTLATLCACAAQAQAPAATPAPAAKVALTSLVGDTLYVTQRRDTTGTNLRSNPVDAFPVPNASLDLMVLKAAEEAVRRALPGASIAMLRVPAAGTPPDPAQMVVDGKLAERNSMIDALRQGGYTHLVAVAKLRAPNGVKLADRDIVGTGQLEGLGFYIDRTIEVQRVGQATDSGQGIIAPHAYIQLSLVDLASQQVKAVERIAASGVVASYANPGGTDPWGALTATQKAEAIERLIKANVGPGVARLFEAK